MRKEALGAHLTRFDNLVAHVVSTELGSEQRHREPMAVHNKRIVIGPDVETVAVVEIPRKNSVVSRGQPRHARRNNPALAARLFVNRKVNVANGRNGRVFYKQGLACVPPIVFPT